MISSEQLVPGVSTVDVKRAFLSLYESWKVEQTCTMACGDGRTWLMVRLEEDIEQIFQAVLFHESFKEASK